MNKVLLQQLRRRIDSAGKDQVAKELAGAMTMQCLSKARHNKKKGIETDPEDLVRPLDDDKEYMALMADIGLTRDKIKEIAGQAIKAVSVSEDFNNSPKKQYCPVCNKTCKRQRREEDRAVYNCKTHGEFSVLLGVKR